MPVEAANVKALLAAIRELRAIDGDSHATVGAVI
jgi:hypothetical protein